MIKKSFTKRHWSNQELVTTDIKSIVLCLKLVAKASNDTKHSRKLRLDIH